MTIFCYGLLLVTIAFNAGAQGAFSGVISFGNVNVSDDRRIWVNNTGVVGEGTRASGTSYKIALYYSPQPGATEAQLVQVGTAASFSPLGAGQFSGGSRTVTGLASAGGVVTVQARGWRTVPGVPDTYEAVLAAGLSGDPSGGQVGKGPVFAHDTFRPGDPTDPATQIGNDPNWRGFAIGVPEPSVIALGLLGVGTLLMLHRRSVNRIASNIRR